MCAGLSAAECVATSLSAVKLVIDGLVRGVFGRDAAAVAEFGGACARLFVWFSRVGVGRVWRPCFVNRCSLSCVVDRQLDRPTCRLLTVGLSLVLLWPELSQLLVTNVLVPCIPRRYDAISPA